MHVCECVCVSGCVFVCVRLHVCGAVTEKWGAVIVRKTEQERERDKDLEKEWRCEARVGTAALFPLSRKSGGV